jgi:predicted small integral membrane protein
MVIRILKAAMVCSVGAWALLIAAGNVIDYDSNWHFVQHVLSMDTVFADNRLKYRAITNPTLQALGYGAIITTEWVMSALCLIGSWRLFAARKDQARFIAAKTWAAMGLTLVFLLYFVGFVAIGGEWFCSWQSQVWNGQEKAVSFLTCAMFVLIVLLIREEDLQDGAR